MRLAIAFVALLSVLPVPAKGSCKACLESNFYRWIVSGIVADVSETAVIVLVDTSPTSSQEIIIPCDQVEIPECDLLGINDRVTFSGHFGDRVLSCDETTYTHNVLVVDSILRCSDMLCELLYP